MRALVVGNVPRKFQLFLRTETITAIVKFFVCLGFVERRKSQETTSSK